MLRRKFALLAVIPSVLFTVTAVAEEAPSLKLDSFVDSHFANKEFRLDEVDILKIPGFGQSELFSISEFGIDRNRSEILRRASEKTNTDQLSIADVRSMSLANNLGLRAQLITPLIAADNVSLEDGRFDMLFSSSLDISSADQVPNPGLASNTIDTLSANFQLDIPTRTGGSVSIGLPLTSTDPNIAGVSEIFDSSLQVSVSQPLLRSAGRSVAEAGVNIAKLNTVQAQARAHIAVIQTIAQTETVYWDLYRAEEVLAIRLQQYNGATELERKAIRLTEARVIPKIEALRAKSGVSRRLESLIVASTDRDRLAGSLKLAINNPDYDLMDDKGFSLSTKPKPVYSALDKAELVKIALEKRKDLIDLELQLDADEISIDFASNQTKPQLDLNARASFADRGDSLSDSLGAEFNSWGVGAQFSLPIGNRAAKAQMRISENQRKSTTAQLDNLEREIVQQVSDAVDVYNQNWLRIIAARQEALIADETLKAEEKQFLAGVRTSTDVLEAASFLADAQIREVNSMADFERAKVNIALAVGTLLEYTGVSFQ